MNEQGKGKKQSYELNKLGFSNKSILEAKRLISNIKLQDDNTINPVIYNGNTKVLSLLLSKYFNAAIKTYYNKRLLKIWIKKIIQNLLL